MADFTTTKTAKDSTATHVGSFSSTQGQSLYRTDMGAMVGLQHAAGNQAVNGLLQQGKFPEFYDFHFTFGSIDLHEQGITRDQSIKFLTRVRNLLIEDVKRGLERQLDISKREVNQPVTALTSEMASVSTLYEGFKEWWEGASIQDVTSEMLFGRKRPGDDIWDSAIPHLISASAALKNGSLMEAKEHLLNAGNKITQAHNTITRFEEGSIKGAGEVKFVLEGLKMSGAIAATIASGGIASGAAVPMLGIAEGTSIGLLGTSAVVGVSAGVYGEAQEAATQGGEMLEGSRKAWDFNYKAIAMRGQKDAVLGFVGMLTGGTLAKYATSYFGQILMSRLKPDQIAAVAERLGINAIELTPQVFLTKGQQFLIDFFSGAATTPITTAVEIVFGLLGGQVPPSGEGFAKTVIDNAIAGGLIQLFLAPFTHGMGGKPTPAHEPAPVPVEGKVPGSQPRTGEVSIPESALPEVAKAEKQASNVFDIRTGERIEPPPTAPNANSMPKVEGEVLGSQTRSGVVSIPESARPEWTSSPAANDPIDHPTPPVALAKLGPTKAVSENIHNKQRSARTGTNDAPVDFGEQGKANSLKLVPEVTASSSNGERLQAPREKSEAPKPDNTILSKNESPILTENLSKPKPEKPLVKKAIERNLSEPVPQTTEPKPLGKKQIRRDPSKLVPQTAEPKPLGKKQIGRDPSKPVPQTTEPKPLGKKQIGPVPSKSVLEDAKPFASQTTKPAPTVESVPITQQSPKGPEVFQELSQELGATSQKQTTVQSKVATVQQSIQLAELEELMKKLEPGIVDLAVQEHSVTPEARQELNVSGMDVESAHVGPTSALKNVPGYSRGESLTTLLPSETHAALDQHWKDWAIALRKQGRTDITAHELYLEMESAIANTPNLSPKTKQALTWKLFDELYRVLSLKPSDNVRLPYPNIKP